MRGLYIHIPFCKKICNYCDFTKRVPKNVEMIDEYLTNLKQELFSYEKYFKSVDTIYIGGGTPSSLSTSNLVKLFSIVNKFKRI